MSRLFGTVVLTGATSGIGAATARLLAPETDHLVLLGREPEHEVGAVLDEVRLAGAAALDYVGADFSELRQVVDAAARVRRVAPRIDLLVNDAGMPGSPCRRVSTDGNELTLQVNALAPALLTRLLLPALGPGSRVVAVASSAHRVGAFDPEDPDLARDYDQVAAYARSKGALLAWSIALADELRDEGVTSVALCPGLNDTPLSAAMAGRVGGPPANGARRVRFAATAAVPTGSYLEADAAVAPGPPAAGRGGLVRTACYVDARIAAFVPVPVPTSIPAPQEGTTR